MKKLFSLIFLCFLGFESVLADQQEAGQFVSNIAEKVINIIESKNSNDAEKENKLTSLFEEVVDIQWISKFVLGKHVQSISQEEISQYEKCYTKFLLKSYIPNFKKYTGQKFKLLNVTKIKDDQFKVDTEIINQRNTPVDINYMLKKVNGHYKIFDIVAENVSLIATQRSEFSSVLSNNGIEYLISQLKQRAEE